MKPHRLYYGDEHHEIAIQKQHRAFTYAGSVNYQGEKEREKKIE